MKLTIAVVVCSLTMAGAAMGSFAPENPAEIRTAAESGDAYAQALLGESLRRGGPGLQQDHEQAAKWITASAKQKHPLGLYNLALLYENGWGVERNDEKAAYLYRLCLPGLQSLADEGQARALMCLGAMYRAGKAVEPDALRAADCYRRAAKTGYPSAQCNYAGMLLAGDGVGRNPVDALQWFRKAGEQGLAEAQYAVGLMYDTGNGVDIDKKQALSWYFRAAEQAHAPAHHRIGLMYLHGKGVDPDLSEAKRRFEAAAAQNYAPSQCSLGTLHFEGQGVRRDVLEAEKWYRVAAEAGHAPAQYLLGMLYLEAGLTHPDGGDAVKWLRAAAVQNDENATRQLAQLGYAVAEAVADSGSPEPMQDDRRAAKAPARKVQPLVMNGLKLGMDIREACQLLNRHTQRSYRIKRELAGQRITVPYDRTRNLITARGDGRVIEFDFPPEIVDQLLHVKQLDGPGFVKAFAEAMRLPPLVPGPTVGARGSSWSYKSPESFELLLFGDRGLILKSTDDAK